MHSVAACFEFDLFNVLTVTVCRWPTCRPYYKARLLPIFDLSTGYVFSDRPYHELVAKAH